MRKLRKPSKRLQAQLTANKRRRWAESRLKEQGGKCYWCAKICPFNRPGMNLTAGHLIPLSRGGPDHYENIVALHERCNQAQGDLLPEEFSEPGQFIWKPPGVPT